MRRPFSSIQEEALLSIFTTWDLVYQGLHRTLRRHDLTIAQYNVLRILRGAGSNGMPLMMLAKRMIVRYPNVTRLTDRLDTDGLIRRERCTQDRRVVRAFVSDAGLALLGRLDGEIEALNTYLMRGAGRRDLQSLIRILEALRIPLRQGDGKLPASDGADEGDG